MVRRVSPSVVNVKADVGNGFEDRVAPEGTGFIVRDDGIVVTNFHVIDGALAIRVITADGGRFDARAIGGRQEADLAVLKIEASGLPTVELGESAALQLGQQVVALGFALGFAGGPSVTSGIVSAVDRTLEIPNEEATYEDLIQTDAAINPGNSGGPLVDLAGRVVGINTAGVGAGFAENIGFAISIDAVKSLIDFAIENPAAPTPFLGVGTSDVTPVVQAQLGLPVDSGALVEGVGGPAAEAGIEVGDVIVALGGDPVDSSEGLGDAILRHGPGDAVEVELVRDGSRITVTATLGARPLPVE